MDLFLHGGMRLRRRMLRSRLRTSRAIMELHLQFGFGMMEHCRHLLTVWGGGTVVLSPRDLDADQLLRLATDVTSLAGGRVLLDPQFYLPHADHDRLRSHDFWPENFASGSFFQGPDMRGLVGKVVSLNQELRTDAIILPGMLAAAVDDVWLAHHEQFLTTARELAGGSRLFSTLALSADAVKSRDQVTALLDAVTRWRADGYYVVCEHPNGDYFVQEAVWLAHVLDLVAGLRLAGAEVVLGYCNQQMLAAHVAGANAICSGTWMNVRSFPPEKFNKEYEEEIRRRATWYYCPQALSEYKIPFLDVAYEQSVLELMKPSAGFDGGYVNQLFSGVQPSSIRFSEQAAFRHYLHSLRGQSELLSQATSYDESLAAQQQLLDTADDLLGTLSSDGVLGTGRDFSECLDVNRAALILFNKLRGPTMRRRWSSL